MPTQEERLSLLEQTVAEYRPVLRDVVYELTIVKGLVTDQVRVTSTLSEQLRTVADRLAHLEQQLDQILTLLHPPFLTLLPTPR
uniref:Uncharacterized protein n=1 Tax=Thermogemmatispora argillosa TaxID=2045280 RepID=A0A455T750_9CHLR|nr:hypothetical protein KTA_33440 [Thermogemmatispora argillosa]